ncbi:virulent strain associated lipoprotein, partial [Reticulomyxa filosa]
VTQLMNTIQLGAEFQQALAGVRAGIVDFVERCSYSENIPFAIQGLNIQIDKYKYGDVDKSVKQAFNNGVSKEAEEISKQLLRILEELKKKDEKKKEIGEKQVDKCSCEIELSIAKNDITGSQAAKDWAQKRKQELNEQNAKDWCNVTKYRTCYTYRWYWWSYSWPYQETYQDTTHTGEQTKLREMEDKMKKENEEFETKRGQAVKKQQENEKTIIGLNTDIDTLEKKKRPYQKTNEEMKEIEKEIDD